MSALGIELCAAGFQAAATNGEGPVNPLPAGMHGPLDWMGLVHCDGGRFSFGRAAEDVWLVQPRQVAHNIWSRLSREPSSLTAEGRAVPFSQIAFYYLRDFVGRLEGRDAVAGAVLAVPGSYLKDEATEDEKIGLLLGMAHELKLPLAGIVDMACAALCDPRLEYFDPVPPLLMVDVHLHGTEVTLLRGGNSLRRESFGQLPQLGFAELLRHLTTTMGNRFLRHTTFDILEDGRIEQAFYRQTKDFLVAGAAEQLFQINTANRTYEMTATREQLVGDATGFVQSIVQGVQSLAGKAGVRPDQCTIALTGRTAILPGIAARLRTSGMGRLLRLPVGAAAAGAASLAARWKQPADLADVPVVQTVPSDLARRVRHAPWEVRLIKATRPLPVGRPTHVICEGVGRDIDGKDRFVIGSTTAKPDCPLPENFAKAGETCAIQLEQEAGRLWLIEPRDGEPPLRTPVEAGDRLVVRCDSAETELLFARCDPSGGRV